MTDAYDNVDWAAARLKWTPSGYVLRLPLSTRVTLRAVGPLQQDLEGRLRYLLHDDDAEVAVQPPSANTPPILVVTMAEPPSCDPSEFKRSVEEACRNQVNAAINASTREGRIVDTWLAGLQTS